MEWLDCMIRVRAALLAFDRFIWSQSRQREFGYETEAEEVVFSNVIERYGTTDVFGAVE